MVLRMDHDLGHGSGPVADLPADASADVALGGIGLSAGGGRGAARLPGDWSADGGRGTGAVGSPRSDGGAGDGGWRDGDRRLARQISRLPRPAVRLEARLHGGMLFCAAGLLAAGLLVPEGYLPSPASAGQPLDLDEEVRQLAEKIDLFKGEAILPQEKALKLEKDLKELRQEASARDPAKTMEAIDHLEQSFKQTAEEAKQEAIQHAEQLTRADDLADALQKCEAQMDPKQFDEAMKELSRMTDQATSQGEASERNGGAAQTGVPERQIDGETARTALESAQTVQGLRAGESGQVGQQAADRSGRADLVR